jgi:thiamine transporter
MTTKEITLMAILVALSIGLDSLKFLPMPNGGSVNGAMIGLIIIALSFSPLKTFIATSIVFGLLTALLDGFFAYYLFDYFFALSGFFIISLVRKHVLHAEPLSGTLVLFAAFTLTFLVRLIAHVISGILFFEVDFAGSLTYNLTYLGPSFLLTLIIISLFMISTLPQQLLKFTR